MAVRVALAILVALALSTPVACGGDDDAETADSTPLTLSQRVLTAGDAPGSKPDPVETRQMTKEFDEFIEALHTFAVDPDTEEMTRVFRGAGFEAAIIDTRFYGETHTESAPHVSSSVVQLQSEEGATRALDWFEADIRKPCPMSCAVQRSEFDVDDIPDARGVRRSATAEDIENLGNANERPFDSYWVGFADGPFVYTVDLHGPPGSVTEDQALKIVGAYYERLVGD